MKLSVIVPVYKVENYLDACVESILNQNIKDFEVILVDDCSPDNCGRKCDEWEKKDKRIKVIHCTENGGLSVARNKGIEIAQGEYITFVDSDDFLAPNTYKYNLSLLEENAKVDILEFPVMANFGTLDEYEHTFVEEKISFVQWIEKGGYKHCYAWNKIFRREIWSNFCFPKGKLMEDLFTIPYILSESNKIMTSNKGLYCYCTRTESLSKKVNERSASDYLQALLKLYNWLNQQNKVIDQTLDDLYLQLCNAQIVLLQLGIESKIPNRKISLSRAFKSEMRQKALLYKVLGRNYCSMIAKVRNIFMKIG